jgi:hypothetical protein
MRVHNFQTLPAVGLRYHMNITTASRIQFVTAPYSLPTTLRTVTLLKSDRTILCVCSYKEMDRNGGKAKSWYSTVFIWSSECLPPLYRAEQTAWRADARLVKLCGTSNWVAGTLLTCILEVTGSNLARNMRYPDRASWISPVHSRIRRGSISN